VTPVGNSVQVQLAFENTTLPTGPWYVAQTAGGSFSGAVLPVAPGTCYVWAYDPVTGAQGVSEPVFVGAPTNNVVPVPLSVVAALLGSPLAGETPDQLPMAGAVEDADTALVAQSGKALLAQPFSAVWAWIQGHLPGYLMPQVTVSTAGVVNLDNSSHNGRILLITAAGVTLQPNVGSLGAGFVCDILNASGATVALAGITTDTGDAQIAVNGIARIFAAVPPGGNVIVFAKL
jgi:hypothetical protein